MRPNNQQALEGSGKGEESRKDLKRSNKGVGLK
jgi:hypothetical protein